MSDEIQKPKSALDKAFEEFEQESANCKFVRKEMIEQLRKELPKVQIQEGDKSMMIQSKMSVISTLSGLLKDAESAAAGKVKLRLSMSEQESAGQYSKTIVNLMKMISLADAPKADGSVQVDETQVQKDLEARAVKDKIQISDGELEQCAGSTPEAPKEKALNEDAVDPTPPPEAKIQY